MQLLRFHPLLKRNRWGGRRLATVLEKPIGPEPDYGESWEISDHGDAQSLVDGGPFDGWSLTRLVTEHAKELLGRHADRTQFPLLIKFLDAHDRLSLQVHPNDALAREFDVTENGKSEAWIVIDAAPDSRLFAGLKVGVTPEGFKRHLAAGTVADCLHVIPAKPGDCIYIPAGTVHAIGEGILLAEVQQSSDLTFRLHDWDWLDDDGKPRELHVGNSLLCTDWNRGPVDPVTPVSVLDSSHETSSHDVEQLVACEHFVIQRHRASTSFSIPSEDRFRILIALEGTATLRCDQQTVPLPRGGTVLIPAAAEVVEVDPTEPVVLLETFLP
jgi:mannose-6-phosphate isomerase